MVCDISDVALVFGWRGSSSNRPGLNVEWWFWLGGPLRAGGLWSSSPACLRSLFAPVIFGCLLRRILWFSKPFIWVSGKALGRVRGVIHLCPWCILFHSSFGSPSLFISPVGFRCFLLFPVTLSGSWSLEEFGGGGLS